MRDWYMDPALEAQVQAPPQGLKGLAAREAAQVDLQQYAHSLADLKRGAQAPAPAPVAKAQAPAPTPAPAPAPALSKPLSACILKPRERETLARAAEILERLAIETEDPALEGAVLRVKRASVEPRDYQAGPRGRPRGAVAELDGARARARTLRDLGMTLEGIATKLMEEGVVNTKGAAQWSKQNVANLLRKGARP